MPLYKEQFFLPPSTSLYVLSPSPVFSASLGLSVCARKRQQSTTNEKTETEKKKEEIELFYYAVFGGLGAVVAALELSKTNRDRIHTSQPFNSFKNNYLFVYSLMMAGDWLQGPCVYYLYSQYGFRRGEIGQLFIAAFGSSMLFGTIVGSLADKQRDIHPDLS